MSSSWCSGSSGSGALTQLIAQGALDAYLSQNATFTFWKVRYNKHTNFAMESIGQPFNTAVSFGSEAQITLNRNGDLIYYMYVVVELPGITAHDNTSDTSGMNSGNMFPTAMASSCAPCKSNDEDAFYENMSDGFTNADDDEKVRMMKRARNRWAANRYGQAELLDCCDDTEDCPNTYPEIGGVWAHWTNDIGQFLIKSARVVIGGSNIDHLYSDFLFMWEELTGKSGRRLTEMVGKRYTRTQLICDSRQKRILYIPLPFWFTQHSGQALALASLQFHGVQIHVDFHPLEKCIVVSGPNISVKNCATGCCLAANDLHACLETTYVYLDNVERDRFATTHYEVLIVQNQNFVMTTTNSQARMNLNFNHPCLELIWSVRRRCHELCNNWFNYSGIDNRDPVIAATLSLNNQARFSNKPGTWFRLVQPYQHHTNIPDCFIYVYSFALHPEDASPSGSCNFSRIDHVDLTLTLQEDLNKEQVTINVFARNWNVLRFREGLCGLAFAN